MAKLSVLALLLVCSVALSYALPSTAIGSSLAELDATANPSGGALSVIGFKGQGCPTPLIKMVKYTADFRGFTVPIATFKASSGPGVDPAKSRSSCEIYINMKPIAPPPRTKCQTVFEVAVEGTSQIAKNLPAENKWKTEFNGKELSSIRSPVSGPRLMNSSAKNSFVPSSGNTLAIKLDLYIGQGNGLNYMQYTRVTGAVTIKCA